MGKEPFGLFPEQDCVEGRNEGVVVADRYSLLVEFAENRDEHGAVIDSNAFLDFLAASNDVDLDLIDVGERFTSVDGTDDLLMSSDESHSFVGAEAMELQPTLATAGVSVKEENMVVDYCAPYPTSDSFSSSEYYSSEVDASPFSEEVAELEVTELTGYSAPLQCYSPELCVLMPELIMEVKEEALEAKESISLQSLESDNQVRSDNQSDKSTRGRKQTLVTRDAVSSSTGPKKSNGRVRRKPQVLKNSSRGSDTKASPTKQKRATKSPKKSASPAKNSRRQSSTSSRDSSPKKKMYELEISDEMTPQEQHGIIKSKKSRAYRLQINDKLHKQELENAELKFTAEKLQRDLDEAHKQLLQEKQRYRRHFLAHAKEISKLKMQLDNKS